MCSGQYYETAPPASAAMTHEATSHLSQGLLSGDRQEHSVISILVCGAYQCDTELRRMLMLCYSIAAGHYSTDMQHLALTHKQTYDICIG
jgi:hypothetical protein